MDASIDRYLHRVDGVAAEIWVPPSRGQLFWLRHAPALFAPAVEGGSRLARWWAIATVTPSTNITVLNLRYQAYLNLIFHRTRLAKVGHAVCMPLIVASMLAACCALPLGSLPVNASLPAAAGLSIWWLWWAVKERDPLWGASGVLLVAALYALANAAYELRPHAIAGSALLAQPLAWVVLGSLLQAASHALEPLPPRVTRSPRWVPMREYLFGAEGRRNSRTTVARRVGHLAAQTVFGTVDELVASPRLLPVLLLDLLWRLGHDPARRAAWRAQAARAFASGNPGLDFIGVGGATPLRIPA
ncbi:hypothetical protein [Dactylosporangium darangshiense]|uniref:Integral membrane protein n=1 Tax=Dactylosporangium darangshiense TaxID=579108 RepID=A0ABP8CTR8_9ACTN